MAGLLNEYSDPLSMEEEQNKLMMNSYIASGNSGAAQNLASTMGNTVLGLNDLAKVSADPTKYSSMMNTGLQDQVGAYDKEKQNYEDYLTGITEPWKKEFYRQYIPQNDKEFRNVQWKANPDGTWSALKSAGGGSTYDEQVKFLQDNAQTDNWFQWTVDPKNVAAAGSTYKQYDAPGTQGNSYAPYFLAAGTLLTGGLLAPVIAGAGLAGGAAIGAGMGAATSIGSQALANSGEVKDWGKVAMGVGTGALGGGFAGAGGFGGVMDKLGVGGGGEFVMNPDTAAAYAMEAYPSGWEGSIYGSPEGLINSTGSLDGLVGMNYGEYPSDWEGSIYGSEEGLVNATGSSDGLVYPEYQAEAMNYEPAPGEDVLAQQASGMNMQNLVKKIGLAAAKKLLQNYTAGSPTSAGQQASGAASGMGPIILAMQGGSQAAARRASPSIEQKLLEYKQAQLDPEYWRFMSTDDEGGN